MTFGPNLSDLPFRGVMFKEELQGTVHRISKRGFCFAPRFTKRGFTFTLLALAKAAVGRMPLLDPLLGGVSLKSGPVLTAVVGEPLLGSFQLKRGIVKSLEGFFFFVREILVSQICRLNPWIPKKGQTSSPGQCGRAFVFSHSRPCCCMSFWFEYPA